MIPQPVASGPLKGRRILLAAEYVGHGGTRNYFRDLLHFYAEMGAEVVAVTGYEKPDPGMRQLVSSLSFDLFTFAEAVQAFGNPGQAVRPSVWNRKMVGEETDFFIRMCDVLGIHQVVLSVGTSGLFLSATHARPDPVMIAHGYPHGRRQRLLGRNILGKSLPVGLRIVTVSDFSGALFRNVWRTDSRGVEVQTVRSTCGPVTPKRGFSGRRRLVITGALLETYKEPFTWIDIARRVVQSPSDEEPPEFMWMGDGDLLNAARARVPERYRGVIHFPGWVEDPIPAYACARAYLQTSSIESLGLSVVDALRNGLPAVVTSAGGLPEVVIDGVNGFVTPVGDVGSGAEAIQELLLNDKRWAAFSTAAQEVYSSRFSPDSWKRGMTKAHAPSLGNIEFGSC